MVSPNNPTPITPPRVAFIDPRTGAISREWYRFFLSLWTVTGTIDNSAAAMPSTDTALAAYEALLANLAQTVSQTPTPSTFTADINAAVQNLAISPDALSLLSANLARVEKQIQALSLEPANNPQLENKRYGSFYDLTNQTAAAVNTAYAMSFGNTQYSNGVTIGSPTSRIYVDRPTIYNIQFSAQLDKTSASIGNVWVWLDLNGTTVADTATQVSLQGSNAATVAAWNFLLEMNAGDYFRLMWATDDTDCYIKHDVAAAPVPDIPSIILTVTDNIK